MIHTRRHWTFLKTPPLANEARQIQYVGLITRKRIIYFDNLQRFVDFFQNSQNTAIFGGNFIASTSNPVVHDPVVREQVVCSFLSPLAQIYVPNNCSLHPM